jgi:hypothetical protein
VSIQSRRRLLIRTSVLVLVLAAAVGLAFIGKRHMLVFDNQKITRNERVIPPLKAARVTIDGHVLEVEEDDRGALEVIGMNHDLLVEVFNEEGQLERQVTFPLRLKLEKMLFISLPILVEGKESPYFQR